MIVRHNNVAYEVKYEGETEKDIDVWLVNTETNEMEELYTFPESVQDRAWDFVLSDFFENNGMNEDHEYENGTD